MNYKNVCLSQRMSMLPKQCILLSRSHSCAPIPVSHSRCDWTSTSLRWHFSSRPQGVLRTVKVGLKTCQRGSLSTLQSWLASFTTRASTAHLGVKTASLIKRTILATPNSDSKLSTPTTTSRSAQERSRKPSPTFSCKFNKPNQTCVVQYDT